MENITFSLNSVVAVRHHNMRRKFDSGITLRLPYISTGLLIARGDEVYGSLAEATNAYLQTVKPGRETAINYRFLVSAERNDLFRSSAATILTNWNGYSINGIFDFISGGRTFYALSLEVLASFPEEVPQINLEQQ